MKPLNEREALDLWREALVDMVRSDVPDLSARQQALLVVVALERGPHTIRGLAERLQVAKPAVSRGIDALEKYSFVRRVPDEDDLRSVFVERTVQGMSHLRSVARTLQIASGTTLDAAQPATALDRELDRSAIAA